MMAKTEERSTVARDLRNFLMLMGGAVVCAGVFVMSLVYFYGPSGTYVAKNVLLSPEVITNLYYNDVDARTGAKKAYVFDKVEFIYMNRASKSWEKVVIDKAAYASFYSMISADESIPNASENIAREFGRAGIATLSLSVKPAEETQGIGSIGDIFQELHLAVNSDIFRIELHSETNNGKWVYFQHPGIYQKAMELLKK